MALDYVNNSSFRRSALSAELLTAETEAELARAWRDDRNEKALHRLVNAYMRLGISMAGKFRRYGVSMPDLIQEAGVGLMKAADRFDPDRGVRFSTYAQWWIKASIQDYVMRNYSMVRTGSTTNQKSLFFNLKRVRASIEREAAKRGERIDSNKLQEMVAEELGVPLRDVELMEGRLSGADFSLNAVQSQDEDGREWLDILPDDGPQAEEIVIHSNDNSVLRDRISRAMSKLSKRERYIVMQRKMIDEPRTLESIGTELGLSKERIRQVESAALQKLKSALKISKAQASEFLAAG